MAQVNTPQSKKRDPLELIMTGLQIAGGILGIRKDMVQTDVLKQNQEQNQLESEQRQVEFDQKQTQFDAAEDERSRRNEGRLLPTEELDVSRQFVQAPEGTRGAVKVISPTSGAPVFLVPRPEISKTNGTDTLGVQRFDFDKQKFSEEKKQKEILLADNINSEFNNDKFTAKYVDAYEKSSSLQSLLTKKHAVIDAIALRKVFGLSGDTGAIRAEDLEQFSTNPALLDRFVQIFNKGLEGQVIPENERKYLLDFASDMNANARVKFMKNADKFASRIANTTSMDKKKALEYLNPSNYLTDYSPHNQESSGPQKRVETGAVKKKTNEDVLNGFISQ